MSSPEPPVPRRARHRSPDPDPEPAASPAGAPPAPHATADPPADPAAVTDPIGLPPVATGPDRSATDGTGHGAEPGRNGTGDAAPRTAEPSTAEPSTAEPSTAEPSTAEPRSAEPSTAEPRSAEPRSAGSADDGPADSGPRAAGSRGTRARDAEPGATGHGTERGRNGAGGGGAHGHGHGHGPAARADRRVRIAIAALLVPAVLATLVGLVLLAPGPRAAPSEAAGSAPRVPGHVSATREADCDPGSGDGGCVALTVELGDGRVVETLVSVVRGVAPYATGDDIVLTVSGDPADPESYLPADFQRGTPLLVLALLFAAAVVALGGWRGAAALAALGLSGTVLVFFLLPAILAGRDPLAVAVVGCSAIMFGVLYLTHGVSARTSTAVLGTFGSLVLIGVLGVVFTGAARLTGVDEDTSSLSNALGTAVDGRGIVLAGLMLGALGALDDVTVTQTSAVWELRRANPGLRPAALFTSAMRIGRDHVASAVNTLVLAYAGAALPLLLLFSVAQRGLADTLTTQVIATEVVRTLVGSIGLVAAVPLTTALAVAVVTRGELAAPAPTIRRRMRR